MYQVTMMCITQQGEYKALHVQDATTATLDAALREHAIDYLDYVVEQYTTMGNRTFYLWVTQAELHAFRMKWQLAF